MANSQRIIEASSADAAITQWEKRYLQRELFLDDVLTLPTSNRHLDANLLSITHHGQIEIYRFALMESDHKYYDRHRIVTFDIRRVARVVGYKNVAKFPALKQRKDAAARICTQLFKRHCQKELIDLISDVERRAEASLVIV